MMKKKKRDANHWKKGDHSGARFDLCTMYGYIHQHMKEPDYEGRLRRSHCTEDLK